MDLIEAAKVFASTLVTGEPQAASKPASRGVAPVKKKVLVISFNPRIKAQGGKPLTQVLGWFDPAELTKQYVADIKEASYGYLNYEVVEFKELDEWPLKTDGFRYDETAFLGAWQKQNGFHDPDAFDYPHFVAEHNLVDRVESGELDEVWLWGMPYAGFWESHMVGPQAYFCNSPAMKYPGKGYKRFIVMGFNYQRDVGQALHSFGHRTESLLAHIWQSKRAGQNLWELFTCIDKDHPGKAQVGNVHFAPNSERDYDVGNARTVMSACDDWLTFPTLPGVFRPVTSADWGNGNERAHMLWWLKRIPHVNGETQGISNNWWEYMADPGIV
jgi:hypothetical protein